MFMMPTAYGEPELNMLPALANMVTRTCSFMLKGLMLREKRLELKPGIRKVMVGRNAAMRRPMVSEAI